MDWTNKNIHPSKVVQLGDEVEVMILEIDEDRRRISLGMKQCMPNPWDEFAMNHKKGDKVKGQIKSITDFGVFIGLPGGIDGLVHLSDLSWTLPGEEGRARLQEGRGSRGRGAGDRRRARAHLARHQAARGRSVHQLRRDARQGQRRRRARSSRSTRKGAVIALDGDVEGYLRASEVARDRVEDIRTHLKEGDAVKAMIINIDRKNRTHQPVDQGQGQRRGDARRCRRSAPDTRAPTPGTTNLGALLKAKLDNKTNE